MTAHQTHLSHPKYRPDIDGLRAIAVLAVVAFHAFPNLVKGGFIGVDVFFVISGYLISTIIFESLDKGTFRFSEFYARRIKRIFPALILVLVACFIFGWFALLADEYKQLGKHIAAGAGFISNIVFWSEAGYFDNAADTKPLLHLWSLGIEEQFYFIWPFLLWFAWKRNFSLLIIVAIFSIISFVLNIKGIKQDPVATFYLPQTRFWELLSGSLLAWITLYKNKAFTNLRNKFDGYISIFLNREKEAVNGKLLSNFLSFFGFVLLAYGFWRINKKLSFPGMWALVPVMGTLLLLIGGSESWLNRKILSNKIAVWFGLISFPLYLWHWPLLSFARIVEGEAPSRNIRLAAVALAVVLAWLTYKLVERPLRFGKYSKAKVAILFGLVFFVGVFGAFVNETNYSKPHTYETLAIKRKGFEHAFGSSLAWYRGKDDWLFLGNSYDNTVAKLKLSIVPTEIEVEANTEIFSKIATTAAQFNTKVVLIVGPNKSSIYPEYLPDKLVPSTIKYSSFFLEKLSNVQNLTVYNPTDDFLRLKKTEGILYWMTNTHWNNKGAFLAYSGFSNLLGLPVPQVKFQQGLTAPGDLIKIAKLKDFPLHPEDNWDVIWKNKPVWTEKEIPNEQKTAFGSPTIVTNQNPLSNKYIWVVGDSFTGALRKYFNATYKEVRYVGHWSNKLKDVPEDLAKADRKPDMVIVVRVERSF
jgi:peptidoglycan/LPS O-acetylase OafA/YrhL